MTKKILIVGVVLGMLSIILGAFASHGLENALDKDAIETFLIGVRYQMYHALFLLFVGIASFLNDRSKRLIFILVILGVVLFSGSLYGLATNTLTAFNFKSIGFLTPIGGLFMILGWLILLIKITSLKLD